MTTKKFVPVKSADRVFDILEEIIKNKEGLHIRELGKKLNIADSSIHALVQTMMQRRYLKMDESRKLQLGSKFYEFSEITNSDSLMMFARPFMKTIKNKFDENVHLAVLDGLDAIYIAFEESTHPIRYHMEVGKVQPAHIGGVGKMLLSSYTNEQIEKLYSNYPFEKLTPKTIDNVEDLIAELDRIRSRGYSIDNSESYEGCKCFAAPIYNAENRMIASMSISIPFISPEETREPDIIATIKETTQTITALLKEEAANG